MKRLFRTVALFAAIAALGRWLPQPVRAVLILSFCLAAFAHFGLRIIRHRIRGNVRAAGVSLALAFLALGPVVVVGVIRGIVPKSLHGAIELCAFMLSAFLTIAILRVEYMDDARERRRRSAIEDAAELAEIRRRASRTGKV